MTGAVKKLFLPNVKETFMRFPLAIICSYVFTILSILEIFDIYKQKESNIWLYVLLACAFFFYTNLKLFVENHEMSKTKQNLLTIAITMFLASFLWERDLASLWILLFGIVLVSMVAPYILNQVDEAVCCNFNTKLASSIFFALLATVILCAGISFIFVSIEGLFGIKIPRDFYFTVWTIGYALFAPIYTLSGIPKNFDPKEKEYPKGVFFILSYILAPLIIAYFAILYAYILKIIFEFSLPQGKVSYMVVSFGFIGIFTHMFFYPLREKGNRLVKIIYKDFYYALLAPIALLFLGIYVRISDYGVTEARYVIVLLFIWLLISAIYFIIKKSLNFKVIILTLATMLILASFGIWGADSVSGKSQVARLESLLIKNNILVDGKIQKATSKIGFADEKNISSIVEYIIDHKKVSLIQDWFSEYSYVKTEINEKIPRYGESKESRVMKDMGLAYIHKYQRERKVNKHVSFTPHKKDTKKLRFINIQGFDYYKSLGSVNMNRHLAHKKSIKISGSDKELDLYVTKEGLLEFRYVDINTNTSLYFDIYPIFEKLIDEGIETGVVPEEKQDLFVIDNQGKNIKMRLYINSISGKIRGEEREVTYVNIAIAVK